MLTLLFGVGSASTSIASRHMDLPLTNSSRPFEISPDILCWISRPSPTKRQRSKPFSRSRKAQTRWTLADRRGKVRRSCRRRTRVSATVKAPLLPPDLRSSSLSSLVLSVRLYCYFYRRRLRQPGRSTARADTSHRQLQHQGRDKE